MDEQSDDLFLDPEADPGAPDEIIRCWCGERGTFEELFDDAVYDEPCGGSGVLYCHYDWEDADHDE